jgi:hypothetical protein
MMKAQQISTSYVVLSSSSTVENETKSLCLSFEVDTTPPYGELKRKRRASCSRAVMLQQLALSNLTYTSNLVGAIARIYG